METRLKGTESSEGQPPAKHGLRDGLLSFTHTPDLETGNIMLPGSPGTLAV
jgi:hypothetical protein